MKNELNTVDIFCGAAFASSCTERLMTETPEERAKRMALERKENEGRAAREEEFRKRNRVRYVERMCGNCKHGVDMLDEGSFWCKHPFVADTSLYTSEGMVCDAWEGKGQQ